MQPPVSGVQLEPATAPDGAPVARVRVGARAAGRGIALRLAQPDLRRARSQGAVGALARAAHAVDGAGILRRRSRPRPRRCAADRAEDDQLAGDATHRGAFAGAARWHGHRAVRQRPPGRVEGRVVSDLPARVLLDFEGVAMGSVPSTTAVNQGEVQRVRVGGQRQEPFITRVVIDLARKIPYTVQTVGEELRVMFARATEAATSMVATAPRAAATPAAVSGPGSGAAGAGS